MTAIGTNVSIGAIDVPMSKAMERVVVDIRVTGVRVARLRLWLAARVFLLGALIAGCGVEMDLGERRC